MNWFVQARSKWPELLGKQETTVSEQSDPTAIEIRGNIDLSPKTKQSVKAAEWLRKRRFLLPAGATLGLAYVMFFPCDHNSVWLSVKVNAVSFTLDRDGEGPILKEISLKRMTANPIDVFRTCDEKSSPLESSRLDHEGGTVTVFPKTRMRLNKFVLPAATNIALMPQRQRGLRLAFAYPMATIAISGTADGLPDKGGCDFQFQTRGTALELIVAPEDPELTDPVYGQIPIKAIDFNLPDFELGRSLSSISSGMLSFTDMPEAKYTLERGSRLLMDMRRGTLADLRVSQQEISLLLQADASRVRIGYQDQRDITPTKLDWLRSKARNIELWLGLLYLTAILYGVELPRFGRAGR